MADLTEETPCPPGIPERVFAGLKRFVFQRVRPGSHLSAVLMNNLSEALATADSESLESLRVLVAYVYWELPGTCWGSREKFEAWLSTDPQ